jgi:hypothetical protein
VQRGDGGDWRMLRVAFALRRSLCVDLGPSSRCRSTGELSRVSRLSCHWSSVLGGA